MRRGILAVGLVVTAALVLGMVMHGPGVRAKSSRAGLEVVPLNPHALAALKAQGKTLKMPVPAGVNQGRKFNPKGELVGQLPVTYPRDLQVLVLFVDFSDEPPGGPAERLDLTYFDDMLFGTEYDPQEYAAYPGHPTDRTLVNYIDQTTLGKVDVVTVDMPSTTGWLHSGKAYSDYCKADGIHDNGFGPYPDNAQGLVIDAIKAADAKGLDFTKYAEDGVVPNLFVVHAGTGAEWSAAPDIIWSHSWGLDTYSGTDLVGGFSVDGVKVNNYAMMPEVGGDLTGYAGDAFGPYPPTVGVFAHELGHVVGLPDQYDYGYESSGTGNFSLMAGGSWNQSAPEWIFAGDSPSLLDAWSKYRLGVISPKVVKTTTAVTLKPAETNACAYKMVVPGSGGKEYFLFENRQNIGFDEGLQYFYLGQDGEVASMPIHGMTVYHVDDCVFTLDYWLPNEAENWKEFRSTGWRKAPNGATHYAISVVQADDFWDLEHGWNGGDPGDTYPGYWNATRLGNKTLPNTSSYYFWLGNQPRFGYSGVTASAIEETGQNVSATLSFRPVKAD
jgi:immune inhibitor A